MIQIRRLRSAHNLSSEKKDVPLNPDVHVRTVAEVFQRHAELLEKIHPEERWNIYYTLGDCNLSYHRDWSGQEVLPFDIDGIVDDDGKFDEQAYLDAIFPVLGVDPKKCAIVASGNGLQIVILLQGYFSDKIFFTKQRKAYENICNDIAAALTAAGLKFKEVDASSFAYNRLFRFPGTENRKEDKKPRMARLINGTLEPQEFPLRFPNEDKRAEKADPLGASEKEQLNKKQLSYFKIDTASVEAGCDFLKWAKANPAELSEPQWYGLLSVVGQLEDGRQLAHSYSAGHPSYTERGTDRKLDQALAASGPRTCDNIDSLWGKCAGCPNFKKVPSPVSIKSETFIATDKSGFYLLGKNGGLQPQYEDLRRFFNLNTPYKTHEKSGLVYVWDGKKYAPWSMTQLRNYAHVQFLPKPQEHVACEFGQWVNRTNLVDHGWFRDTTRGFINFANGVLELKTNVFSAHEPSRGFLYTLPYGYEPGAECPVFTKFMGEITCGDTSIEKLLLEFLGYTICDPDYWLQKALLLIGEGSNGKSTFLKIAEELSGRENVAFLSLFDLQQETSRSHLEGKLLNISDELPNYNFKNTELLKKLLGGTMTARRLYHDGIMIENSTKFIFAGNDVPETNDTSEGLFRRLVIVPFNASFKLGAKGAEKAADITLVQKMRAELPGIFNRIVTHYQELRARGHLIEAEKAAVELARYREQTDRIGSWVDENLYWNGRVDDGAPKVELNSVFERYQSDAKRGEERPLSKYHFTKRLRRKMDRFDDRYVRKRGDGDRGYILRGVEFRREMNRENF